MKILIACEYSQRVGDAFSILGHDVTTCDLLPGEGIGITKHVQGDVTPLLKENWDMIIAFPSCQYLTNSGVRWLVSKDGNGNKVFNQERWENMIEATKFFKLFLNHPCEKIAIENPIMHGYAKDEIGKEYSQIVQPHYFGDPYTKATCLWLKGLPELKKTNSVNPSEGSKMHKLPPSKYRAKLRSLTPQGLADAMAQQWG